MLSRNDFKRVLFLIIGEQSSRFPFALFLGLYSSWSFECARDGEHRRNYSEYTDCTRDSYMWGHPLLLLLLLLLLKKVSSARQGESDIHPIGPKTPAPQYQPIDRKKRKGKRVEDYSRDRAAQANKEALALLLKTASPTPLKTELARSFQRDTGKRKKVLQYCKVLQRGCA